MKIVWDEPKRLANLKKHRLDFKDLNEVFFDNAVIIPSYGNRSIAVGVSIRGVIVVVFVHYGREGVSVISMRPASRKERGLYEANRR